MPTYCICGCRGRVARKGQKRKPCAIRDCGGLDTYNAFTREEKRRQCDPQGTEDLYQTTPRDMLLSGSACFDYTVEDIYLIVDKLSDAEYVFVDPETGGMVFHGTPRRLNNMVNNPINNAARVAARAAEAAAYMKVHGEGDVMEDPQVLAERQRIVAIPLIRNLLEQRTPLYFGITGCADVKDEDLRWLTARGLMKSDGTFSGAKNRPVLVF